VEPFTLDGTWWLPETPARRIPGTLTFNEDGLWLVVYGSLPETTDDLDFPDWAETPAVLGQGHDGKKVTILRAEGANLTHPGTSRSNYKVGLALLGAHTTQDSFTGAWCEFDCLNAWADPPSLVIEKHPDEPHAFRFDHVQMDSAEVEEAEIRLVGSVAGEVGSQAVHIDQCAMFELEFPEISSRDVINKWIRPLMDLLTVCLGRPVRLTSLRLLPTPTGPKDSVAAVLFGNNRLVDAFFSAVQAPPGKIPTVADLAVNATPTLLTYHDSPIPFEELVPRWFSLRSELRDVFVLFTGPYHATFMFDEHRYASVFQSAESLARSRLGRREKTRDEHAQRVNTIVAAAESVGVDPETVEWARRVLQARNDKPLWLLVEELAKSTGAVGDAILAARPDFSKLVASLRAGVSHPGLRRDLDYAERYWLADALRWIIRARTLLYLGLTLAEVEQRVQRRNGFTHMLEQIASNAPSSPPGT
jgi:hypothetical protein